MRQNSGAETRRAAFLMMQNLKVAATRSSTKGRTFLMTETPIDLAREFVERELVPWPEFVAALTTGSVGHDEARSNSAST